MPDSSSSTATSSTGEDTDFGANDWLLEEMYEQYSADPNSVDQAWATYFAEHGAPGAAAPAQPQRPASTSGPRPASPSSNGITSWMWSQLMTRHSNHGSRRR